jgi:UDPglucose 6-dehydrogenase
VIFVCVPTPPRDNGDADLTYVEAVSREIAICMPSYRLIVEKSTVPVNTGEWVEHTVSVYNKRKIKFDVASNPEFLKEGSAIGD